MAVGCVSNCVQMMQVNNKFLFWYVVNVSGVRFVLLLTIGFTYILLPIYKVQNMCNYTMKLIEV